MPEFGFSEREAREFITRELDKTAASTSFYWESEDVEEAIDLIVDAVSRMIAANNKKFKRDMEQELKRRMARR